MEKLIDPVCEDQLYKTHFCVCSDKWSETRLLYIFSPDTLLPLFPPQHCPSEQVLGLLCWARHNCNPCFWLPSPHCVSVLHIIFLFPQLPHMLLLSPVSIHICSKTLPVVFKHGYPLESLNILYHFSPHRTPSPPKPNTQAKIRISVIFTNR